MRRSLIAALLVSSQLAGCFVFIPGSVVGAVSDSITGDKGEHCVSRGTVVGQRISLGFGRVGVVEHVGKTPSSRCPDPMMPMRAALAFPPDVSSAAAPVQVSVPLRGSVKENSYTLCFYTLTDGRSKSLQLPAGESCPSHIAE